jgi:hypothetical protein
MPEWKNTAYRNKEDKILYFDYDPQDDYNLIISRENGDKRQFTMFSTPIEFKKYESSILEDEKCFYEVILGKRHRKPYFDIDVCLKDNPNTTEEKMNYLIDILVENIKELLVEYKPKILVFTSHRSDKLSYHVVVDRVFLQDNEECKLFAEKVAPLELQEFLDTRVYSSLQQFRVINSRKSGKKNKKTLNYMLSDNFFIPKEIKSNEFRKQMYILYSSLVTFTSECSQFKIGGSKKKNKMRKGNASEFDVDMAMDLLHQRYKNFEIKQIRELNGNILVELISSESYFCNIHNRIHDNENAYITIKGMMKNIWFDCRRIEDYEKKLSPEFIGYLFSPKRKTNTDIKFSVNID